MFFNNNRISEISKSFKNLISIIDLDLSGNYIRKIPEAIKDMKKLTILELNIIEIEEIPDILKFSKVRNIELFENLDSVVR